MKKTAPTFPDPKYLDQLVFNLRRKLENYYDPGASVLMLAGGALNWVGDYLSDPSFTWRKVTLPLDNLTLTGTGPDWNAIVIERCKRSPVAFRKLLAEDASVRELFAGAEYSTLPILVREDRSGELKVLDGMHRVIAAIRDGMKEVDAFIGTPTGAPRPSCEPHVVYDLLRAYERGLCKDRTQLVAALRFLRSSYANVDEVLTERFSKQWLPNDEMQGIIHEALA